MTDIQDARTCLECEKPLEGRANQQFCDRACLMRFRRRALRLNGNVTVNDNGNARVTVNENNGNNGNASVTDNPASVAANGNGTSSYVDNGNARVTDNVTVNFTTLGQKGGFVGGNSVKPEDMVTRGKLRKTISHASKIFKYQFELQIRYNEFFNWYEILDTGRNRWRQLSDSDLRAIRDLTGKEYLDEYSSTMTQDACELIGDENPWDPLKEAFKELKWDGVKRVDTWVETYLGAANDPLTRSKGRRFLISAVSRAMLDPTSLGSKVDTTFILVGGQGSLKSTVFRTLAEALVPGSFLDDYHFGMDGKETLEQSGGKFIVEAAEVKGFDNRSRGNIKQSLSKQSDKARMAYGHIAVERPRRFVIVGSSNEDDFLEDHTGSRRFWIVKVGKIDLEALERDVAQLWAEARVLWKSGEKWWLAPEEETMNEDQNLEYMSDDPWVNALSTILGTETPGIMPFEGIAKLLGIPAVHCDARISKRIARLMKQLKFNRDRITIEGKRVRGYIRGTGGKELVDTSNLYVTEWGKTVKKKDDSIL